MNDDIRGLLYGSFIGDALSLGGHWIYNPSKIKRLYNRVTDYQPPIPDSYHKAKIKGDFTHYGDQTLILLESISERKSFDLEHFFKKWQRLFSDYKGYIDKATTETLERFNANVPLENIGSSSNDLSGAARIAPLFIVYNNDQDTSLYEAACRQTAMTHNDPEVTEASIFFASVVFAVLSGNSIVKAIENAEERRYQHLPVKAWIQSARQHVDEDPTKAIAELGATCHAPVAFPSTILLLLKYPNDLETCLIENVMAGGDSAARGLILGMIQGAKHGYNAIPKRWISGLNATSQIESLIVIDRNQSADRKTLAPTTKKVTFSSTQMHALDARLELPVESPRGFALFAHCFTCSKEALAASRITRALSERGIAVLRFDFTGLGNSQGDFANTNFSSNLQDLLSAASYLRKNYKAPTLLIGHSLGGTAVLAVSKDIPEVKGVVTIGAPSDPFHVSGLLENSLAEIDSSGRAKVTLGGRPFTIKKQFLEDLRDQKLLAILKESSKATLIMHSPVDQIVSIDHARIIFDSLKHPKSFVSLHPADHLLTRKEDTTYVAELISAWSTRLVSQK